MTATITLHSPSRRRWLRWGGVAVLAVACAAGGTLAADMLRGHNPLVSKADADAAAAAAAHHEIAEDVHTSFGIVAVEHAVAISGLNDQQVTGAHGVPGLVEAGSIDVQVGATITNLTEHTMPYSPEQFQLLDGKGNVIALERAPQLPGELQPYAAIDILLDFVTTAEARPFTVQFIDPATKQAIYIDLGAVGCTVQSGSGRPLPVEAGCSKQQDSGHQHS